jgi:hypothetical protein
MKGLPEVVIPFVSVKPTGARDIGFPFPEHRRGMGKRDPWLPDYMNEIAQGKHYGEESIVLWTVIHLAHHDPPMLPDPENPDMLIVNHQGVINVIKFLIEQKCDINAEFVDPESNRSLATPHSIIHSMSASSIAEWRPHCTTRQLLQHSTRKAADDAARENIPL